MSFSLSVHQACEIAWAWSAGLWTFLSSREHLRFALACYRPDAFGEELSSIIDGLLSTTGLKFCADVRTGTDELQEGVTSGLSGGQRRRLTLALAVAKQPAVLIADEPTTGLDAAAAAAITSLLRELSRATRMAVVCTIHQPSSSVYADIDTLLLLSRGTTAYYGPAGELGAYLGSLGKPVPASVSLPEHALDLVNADFVSVESVEQMLDAWRKRASAEGAAPAPIESPLPPAPRRASVVEQLAMLVRRHSLLMIKGQEKADLITRLAGQAVVIAIVGGLYWRALHWGNQLSAYKISQFGTVSNACERVPHRRDSKHSQHCDTACDVARAPRALRAALMTNP